jgi:hypothetical protein
MMEKGSGFGVVLLVGIVFFIMEYTNFAANLSAALGAWSASANPSPTTTPSTTQVINAAGQIDTKQNAATTNTDTTTKAGGSVG